jgi:hypothetical protein
MRSSAKFEANRAFGGGGVDGVAVLGDEDFVGGDEATGSGAGGFHEAFPGLTRFGSANQLCGFGGADGLVAAAFGEQLKDGGFEGVVGVGGLMATAGVGAIFYVVPVALPLFAPGDGAAAGLAELVGVRGDAFGFVFAVGHG